MRIPSGVSGFDHLIQGGFLPGRLYVLSGPPGSGKTTFTAQFVAEGLRNGENCLYVTMHESRDELVEDMSSYGFGFETLAASEQFRFVDLTNKRAERLLSQSAGGNGPSSAQALADKLAAFVGSRNIERLVIDSTMLLELFFAEGDAEMTRFLTALKECDPTTLLISEMTDPSAYSDEHFLAHGVVFFHNYLEATGMTRGLQVVKMRGTDIDSDIRSLRFTDDGLVIDPTKRVDF